MTKVFIDGSAGTTGLRIKDRLAQRQDITLLKLPEELRKDTAARKEALAAADIAFLCLPDAAAVEAVALAEGTDTVLIDTSTAHRTADGWEYGFSELSGRRERIASAKRIANPGCHAGGFIALTAPLVSAGIIPADAVLSCFSLTGYSGGGKKMIEEYSAPDRDPLLDAPRMYGLSQEHKHLKEMAKISGLHALPLFCPIVAPFYAGMEVTVTLARGAIRGSMEDIREVYRTYYQSGLVRYEDSLDRDGFISAAAMAGRDDMRITCYGNSERITLVSVFDNLGKGASGSAIQNMNTVMGVAQETGLVIF